MKNLKMMSDNSSDSSQSSSSADCETISKFQEFNTSNFSSLNTSANDSGLENEWEPARIARTALATLCTNVSKIESTEGISEKEKNVSEKQLQMNKEIMEQLQVDLETLITSAHDARAAQAVAEVELSKLKTTMEQHVTEAVAFLQEEAMKQYQLFEEKISNMEKELVHMEWLRQQVMLLEEQRQKLTSNTGVTPVVLNDEYYDLIQENESLKFQLEGLREEKGDIYSGGKKGTTNVSRNVEQSSSGEDESSLDPDDDDDDDPHEIVERKDGKHHLLLAVGQYHVLLSDQRYFEIDWTEEYESPTPNHIRCKKCSFRGTRSTPMKDHVWCKHYMGEFICPYCTDSNYTFAWRQSVRDHIMKHHPSVFVNNERNE